MRVAELWRYPVKSLQGERLDVVEVGPQGLAGDRQWAIFDRETGFGLTARRLPRLLYASARLRADGEVEIILPDGTVATDDAMLSDWLERPVELRPARDERPRYYETPRDAETEAPESWRVFPGRAGAFHDSVDVTMLSPQSAGNAALARFRANVIVDTGDEDDLVGSTVRIGNAVLEVTKRIRRCAMVTRPQPGGIGLDREVLRRIHRERGGRMAVGCRIVRGGVVAVGDEVVREPS